VGVTALNAAPDSAFTATLVNLALGTIYLILILLVLEPNCCNQALALIHPL
jgi:hypothetical protein